MKNQILFLAFFLITFTGFSYAQSPNWIKYENRLSVYSEDKYLTGFSSEINYNETPENELIDKCKGNAKNSLVESVMISIKSMTESGLTNLNSAKNAETFEYIKHSSVSYSNLDIAGLVSETYYDKRKNTAYAFTYVKKTDVIVFYKQKVNANLQMIQLKSELAEESKASGQSQSALPKLLECLPLFRETEEAQSILAALGIVDDASIQSKRTIDLKSKVDKSIDELNNSVKSNISDLAYFIAYGIKLQAPKITGSIGLSSFNYQDTKAGSSLSKLLYQELEQKLVSVSNLKLVNQEVSALNGNLKTTDNMVTGTYWEEGDNLKIIVVIRELKSGKALASIESKLKKDYCTKNNIEFLPENFIEANKKAKIFNDNEIVGGDLNLEVWTNKGNSNLLYSQDDTLRLYIRTNKECYVRFIYHLADGSSVLLLDDFYMGVDKVNKVYQLPDEFVCSEPFGAEMLQVNASTEKFEPLIIKEQSGYKFISNELADILIKNRGFKKLDDKVQKAENRLVITTMPK